MRANTGAANEDILNFLFATANSDGAATNDLFAKVRSRHPEMHPRSRGVHTVPSQAPEGPQGSMLLA
jgi:hypothetical protein